MIVPLFDLLMFVILFGAAVYYRRRPAAHKRLMLLTAVNFLPPTIARIPVAALQGLGPFWFFGDDSNCLQSQAVSGRLICCHVVFVRIMAFRIVSSLRLQATRATFFGLPAATSRR